MRILNINVMLSLVLLSLSVVSLNYVVASNEKVVVCYYGTWATYRHGAGKFDVEHIDTNLCTHLIYTFVGINQQGGVISLDPYLDLKENWGRNNFGRFNDLKKKNPNLKTILAVGGWNEGSAKYSVMAADPIRRKNFIDSALSMIRTYGFDGFDLDWEYPNRRDTVHGQADVDNFSLLLKEMKAAFEPYGLLLTAAVGAVEEMASQSYDISAISQYLDLINIMTYDLYGAWDSVTGHNAGLHKGQGDEGLPAAAVYSVDLALKYWLDQGCPPSKLVLGLPLYGRTFALANPSVNGVRAPASGAGIAGPYTATNGFIGYNEFCARLTSESWEVRFDPLAKVPYAFRNRDWVSYDTPDSLEEKVRHGLNYDIAGFMVWSIETDDFHGLCHGESFPLLRAINRAAGRLGSGPQTTLTPPPPSPTTTTTVAPPAPTSSAPTVPVNPPNTEGPVPTAAPPVGPKPTTLATAAPTPPNGSVCTEEGLVGDPEDCRFFYKCVLIPTGELQPIRFQCASNLYWDQQILQCNWPHNVNCKV